MWLTLSYFNDPIILPSPKLVFTTFLVLLQNKETYIDIFYSSQRVLLGLCLAFSTGIPVGVLISLNKPLKELIMPLAKLLQATPVISWILLALIWFKIDIIPIFILFLNSFPILVINVYEGFLSIDKKLLDMSSFYKVSKIQKIKNLYIPSIVSHLLASTAIILSGSFKIIVMSEIITKINNGIGSNINSAWINIETEKILAWTIIAIILSFIIERLASNLLIKKLGRYYA